MSNRVLGSRPSSLNRKSAAYRLFTWILIAYAFGPASVGAQVTPPIEDELVVITPVGKTLTDPALAEFTRYAKEK